MNHSYPLHLENLFHLHKTYNNIAWQVSTPNTLQRSRCAVNVPARSRRFWWMPKKALWMSNNHKAWHIHNSICPTHSALFLNMSPHTVNLLFAIIRCDILSDVMQLPLSTDVQIKMKWKPLTYALILFHDLPGCGVTNIGHVWTQWQPVYSDNIFNKYYLPEYLVFLRFERLTTKNDKYDFPKLPISCFSWTVFFLYALL